MGRELQKKKNRSSIAKVRQKPRSKKIVNPRGNPIIAANWDKNLTLAQNYRQLGLLSRLNSRAGGVEKSATEAKESQGSSTKHRDPFTSKTSRSNPLQPREVEVERDPKTGAILRVIDPAEAKPNPLNDPLNDLSEDDQDGDDLSGESEGTKEPSAVVKALEQTASMEVKARPRQQSTAEEQWIQRLVEKYGCDYDRMSKDRKLNPYQQTPADITRRVKKWRANHVDA